MLADFEDFRKPPLQKFVSSKKITYGFLSGLQLLLNLRCRMRDYM